MYDVVIVGIGGMGSATLAHCAARGVRVLGVEQFSRGHAFGASSGRSRVIRRAYFENEAYVPLLNRSYELWRALERESGQRILHAQGLLTAGYRGSAIVEGAQEAVRLHGLDAQTWDAGDIRKRYPALRIDDDDYGVFEPEGGFVVPEAAIAAHCAMAERDGADLRFETRVESWRSDSEALWVELSDGSRVRTARLVLTLGPWFKETMESLGVPIRIQRNVAAWFQSKQPLGPAKLPTFLIDRREHAEPFYGFPDIGDGVKAAFHGLGELTDAGALNREIDMVSDVAPIAAAFEAWAPGSAAQFIEAKACMYSLTPDEHFVIDLHPDDPRIVLCGGFSGHGFKFASIVGELAADLAMNGGTEWGIGFLGMDRFLRS